jgi:hypothetical protein
MMKTPAEILKEAKAAKEKDSLAPHERTILTLREKKYSWRDIAKFLTDRGVETDHSKVFRFIHRTRRTKVENQGQFVVPSANDYVQALKAISISDTQRKMLKCHYLAHNRTVTFTELAKSIGKDDHRVANLHYGSLGRVVGDHMGMAYVPLDNDEPQKPFYSSALGTAKKYENMDWQLIMHHELARAIDQLDWFKASA